jgi:IS30 family transposase
VKIVQQKLNNRPRKILNFAHSTVKCTRGGRKKAK